MTNLMPTSSLVLLFTFIGCATTTQAQSDKHREIFKVCQHSPVPASCTSVQENMNKNRKCTGEYIKSIIEENLNYPQNAKRNGIEGTVVLHLLINKNGEMEKIEVVRSVHESLDDETLRLARLMTDWAPALQGGRAVDFMMNLPIKFKL